MANAPTEEYREHRFGVTRRDSQSQWDKRKRMGFPGHVEPNSVLIGAMGNHWLPGCFEALMAMAEHTSEALDCQVSVYEQQDWCWHPYDSLGTMRNMIYYKAMRDGFEWVAYLDNDVLPEPDALEKLIGWYQPIMAPRIQYPDGNHPSVGQSALEPGRGLAMVGSIVLSFVIFKTDVFRPFTTAPFWQDAMGAAEEYHFSKLALLGHYPFVDTGVTVKVLKPPTFPFDHRPMWGQRIGELEAKVAELEARLAKRDGLWVPGAKP